MGQFRGLARPGVRIGLHLFTHPAQIAARAKALACPGQNHHAHGVIRPQISGGLRQLRQHHRTECVMLVGAVQRQRRHTTRVRRNGKGLGHSASIRPIAPRSAAQRPGHICGHRDFLGRQARLIAQPRQMRGHRLGCHVASRTGGKGAPAQTAHSRIKHPHAEAERGIDIVQRPTIGVVVMPGQTTHRDHIAHRQQHPCNRIGCAPAQRVAQADLVTAHGKEPVRHPRHRRRVHRAVIRAVHHARHIAAHRQINRTRRLNHRGETVQRFVDAGVDIGLGKPFACGPKDRNLIRARRPRILKPAHIRGQRGIAHTRRAGDARQHVRTARHLRHPFGADEAGAFDPAKARVTQRIDKGDLLGDGYLARLILQAVARAHLENLDCTYHSNLPCWIEVLGIKARAVHRQTRLKARTVGEALVPLGHFRMPIQRRKMARHIDRLPDRDICR
mmetsp:Transcript_22728/g.37567  ORF Transcript_22728/g.37567 Transcript_22728/m.37567 type:complete len:446 (-) Transcript_22728:7383-8720(-)